MIAAPALDVTAVDPLVAYSRACDLVDEYLAERGISHRALRDIIVDVIAYAFARGTAVDRAMVENVAGEFARQRIEQVKEHMGDALKRFYRRVSKENERGQS